MKRLLQSPEVIAALISIAGTFLVSVILGYLEGQVGFTTVVVILAAFLLVCLLVLLYLRSGPKVTVAASALMLVAGFLVFVAFGRGREEGSLVSAPVPAAATAATSFSIPLASATATSAVPDTPKTPAPATSSPAATPTLPSTHAPTDTAAPAPPNASADTPTPTEIPRPTATPSCLPVSGPFAAVWNTLQGLVGCASTYAVRGLVAEENFESGKMFWREPVDYAQVLVLFNDGTWQILPHSPFVEGSPDFSCPDANTPSECPPTPKRGFGMVWCDTPSLRERLGSATDCERGYQGWMQQFEWAFMLQTGSGAVIVFYSDNQWERW